MTPPPTSLPTSRLGRTDMEITRVGLGTLAMGGAEWVSGRGHQDDQESVKTLLRAVELGINWLDTAPIYGRGHAERVIGRALREIPAADRPLVFTKGGLHWDESDPKGEPRRVTDPRSLRREVEGSLRRLGVERIDLYQMHWPPTDGTPVEVYWETFVELRDEGKIRAAGLSNHDVPMLRSAEEIGHVDSHQPPFSALSRQAAADTIPWCAAHGTGVIVYAPMESGLLSGAFSRERVAALDPGDWRHGHPDFSGERLERNLRVADALTEVAQRHGVPTSAVAVAWTLAFPGVTAAIVGAKNPGQFDGWLSAAQLRLSPDDLSLIAAAITASGVGAGPVRPGN
ncbi:aldo/keto reductase [Streptomyces hygroscopicus]|uniref:aldo/keto reductase n=1 Tax=Streptomyces hygroscopicus TaxID=1912 RepID=UPI0036CE5BB6